ncbi:MAG: hypothetical protein R2713_03205 [Ilumatobacteraceae bacterium]
MPDNEAADERAPSPPRRAGLFATAAVAVLAVAGALGFAATRDTWERTGPPIRCRELGPVLATRHRPRLVHRQQ